MDVSNTLTLTIEVVHNEKKFYFSMPFAIPYGDAVEAFNEVGRTLVKMAEQAKQDLEKQAETVAPAADVVTGDK